MKALFGFLTGIVFLIVFFGMPKFHVQFDNHVLAVGEAGTPLNKATIERIVDERLEAWHAAHPHADQNPNDSPLRVPEHFPPF